MTASTLLTRLDALRVMLWVDDRRLRYRAPAGSLTPDMRIELKLHKPDLLRLLQPSQAANGLYVNLTGDPADVGNVFPPPTTLGVQHRKADCTSRRWWESVYGGFHCSDCWPPTEPQVVACSVGG